MDSQDNYVYVADTKNHRIQVFDTTGELITTIGKFGKDINSFNEPEAIAVDSNSYVYTADANNLVKKLIPYNKES